VESTPSLTPTARRPDYQRITRELRHQIISGQFAPGARLPSTEKLAATWHSSVYTVHTALATLAREGWLERIHGAGTYVAESKNRFTCAGLYHEADIGSNRQSNFVRSIHDCLLEQFTVLQKETQIFIDSRPMDKRNTVLPALAEAIQNRHIQCVIAPTATFVESPALAKLTVPTAFAGNPGSQNRVDFDKEDFLREGVRCLEQQGCRSIGMICPSAERPNPRDPTEFPFRACFHQVVREEGLETRPDWVSRPPPLHLKNESYGYTEFARMWKLREKPDGIIVFPDSVASGVITSVLRTGIDVAPPKIKFVLHRNAHMNLLCPFPVTWGISDEDLLAKKLIQIIETQFGGEKAAPILLPYEMKFDDASGFK
jgi:DNA-binding LacI/PurR family transcriptional regulator/DNA-binding transcriptional regulator YhcF (GntR family)